jgi:hypothetical protein
MKFSFLFLSTIKSLYEIYQANNSLYADITCYECVRPDRKDRYFKVYGNCGMCEKRIEKAAKVEGVIKALWNVNTKIMTVWYNPDKIRNNDIQKNIADVGHDSGK